MSNPVRASDTRALPRPRRRSSVTPSIWRMARGSPIVATTSTGRDVKPPQEAGQGTGPANDSSVALM